MTADPGDPGFDEADLADLNEDELRAAYEAEIARLRVEDVLVQTVVSLLNLAARKAGLTGADEEPDFEQVRQAIDATTALLPMVEPTLGPGEPGFAGGEVQQRDDRLHEDVLHAQARDLGLVGRAQLILAEIREVGLVEAGVAWIAWIGSHAGTSWA